MSIIPGSIPVTGFIAPTDTSDDYAVTDAIYGIDGLRNVADYTARNNISIERRRAGMVVGTINDGKYWRLKNQAWTLGSSTDWELFLQVGPSGSVVSTGLKYIVESSDDIEIPNYTQYWIYGDLTIYGQMTNYGEVVIADGGLIMAGGTFSNYGTLKFVTINGTVSGTASYVNSATVEFIVTGSTVSVQVITGSLTASHLNTGLNGGATAGYFLSTDVDGNFQWIPGSVILASANGVTGSGTTNYVPKWSSVNSLGDSIITSGVNNVGINVINPSATLDILGGTQNNYPLKLSSTNNTLSRLQHLNLGSVQTDVQVGVNNGSNSIYLGVLGSSVPYLDNRTGQSFTYQVSGVTKLSIDNNGNVGFDLGRGLVYNSGVVFTTDTFNGSSLIIGRGATGTNQAGESYIALGNSAHSTELGIAIGSSADVRENTLDGIAIGRASLVSGGLTRGIAIGRNANARHNNAWAIGYNAITTQDNEFNFGASGTLHKYTFNGQVGIGTASSTVGLHIVATQAGAGFRLVDTTEGVGRVLVSDINGVGTWASSSSIFSGPTGSGTVNNVVRWVTSTQLGNGSIYDSGTAVGIATQSNGSYALNVNGDVNINGTLYATSKSFEITHPLDSTKRLTYGSLEGPEYGVYYRGKLSNENIIDLPDYWTALVNESSITVDITPYGQYQRLFVDKIENNKVYIGVDNGGLPNCYYIVYAERKDIPKIIIEQ